MKDIELRGKILRDLGATNSRLEELLEYNTNVFDHSALACRESLPLPDELFVSAWREYVADAQHIGAFSALNKRLPQFWFPVRHGISKTDDYRTATRSGKDPVGMAEATGLELINPESLEIRLHQSLGGCVPLLLPSGREDFVILVQALTAKNEPQIVPDSKGAVMVSGYNNWDRIHRLKREWALHHGPDPFDVAWIEHFQQIVPDKELYQDRFIIVSDGPYSGVSPDEMKLTEHEWSHLSLIIRREHECTHYFTRRVLGSMRNNILDEIIADYAGIMAACGTFRSDWLLRFLGLENYPDFRESGRLINYRGDPPLSDTAFKILQRVIKIAAENLEEFSEQLTRQVPQSMRNLTVVPLSYLTLEEMCATPVRTMVADSLRHLEDLVKIRDE